MSSKYLIVTLCITGALAGCGGGNPSPPSVGAQIDRMGRAAVNTALTNPFGTVPSQTSDTVKDAYNLSSDPTNWSTFIGGPVGLYIAGNLAILDALDGVCGNQPFAKPGNPPPVDRYKPLATVLADDQLYINTSSGTCANYLAVETGAANDCGGRTPLYNTIDVTYAVVAGPAQSVVNGITQDNDGNASLTAFPFLANPN
ncbi:MAG TPA: hypothetical protein VEM39_09275 [Myxococcaceae bacterium]|nr:hypothetical protein [Myxococcaceae bacterium]